MIVLSEPRVEHSEGADAIYIQFAEVAVQRTEALDDRRMLDWAADGTLLGIEFLDVSGGIDLTGISQRQQLEPLLHEFGFPIPGVAPPQPCLLDPAALVSLRERKSGFCQLGGRC